MSRLGVEIKEFSVRSSTGAPSGDEGACHLIGMITLECDGNPMFLAKVPMVTESIKLGFRQFTCIPHPKDTLTMKVFVGDTPLGFSQISLTRLATGSLTTSSKLGVNEETTESPPFRKFGSSFYSKGFGTISVEMSARLVGDLPHSFALLTNTVSLLALACGLHPRLGENSAVSLITPMILRECIAAQLLCKPCTPAGIAQLTIEISELRKNTRTSRQDRATCSAIIKYISSINLAPVSSTAQIAITAPYDDAQGSVDIYVTASHFNNLSALKTNFPQSWDLVSTYGAQAGLDFSLGHDYGDPQPDFYSYLTSNLQAEIMGHKMPSLHSKLFLENLCGIAFPVAGKIGISIGPRLLNMHVSLPRRDSLFAALRVLFSSDVNELFPQIPVASGFTRYELFATFRPENKFSHPSHLSVRLFFPPDDVTTHGLVTALPPKVNGPMTLPNTRSIRILGLSGLFRRPGAVQLEWKTTSFSPSPEGTRFVWLYDFRGSSRGE